MVVGGGFGGLNAAASLGRAPVEVVLVDRRNFHLFQPLLYQVATGGLSPANIAAPLRSVFARRKNTRVLLGEVADIDVPGQRVVLADGDVPAEREIPYDFLVVAPGARHHYFGKPEWEALAPGLKTIEDATEIRRRVLSAFEAAERETDPAEVRAWLTFVIVGAGPTGAELAGALGEIANDTLRHDFRTIDPSSSRILLLDASDRMLSSYPPDLARKAERSLARLGVSVMPGAIVAEIHPDSVVARIGGKTETIATRTVLWAAGVLASPLGQPLARATGALLDRSGRIAVAPDLTLPGHPEIYVIGDLASVPGPDGKPLPGIAPVAIQEGRYVARAIALRLAGGSPPAFRYRDYGTMATLGRAAAVADFGRFHLSGYPAWLAWLFIHLLYLVRFENRLLVLLQWAWNYATHNRSARLITEGSKRENRA